MLHWAIHDSFVHLIIISNDLSIAITATTVAVVVPAAAAAKSPHEEYPHKAKIETFYSTRL